MSKSSFLCMVDQVRDGEMRCVSYGEQRIVIAKVNNEFFAFDEMCTHEDASLYNGALKEYCVECPLHGSLFDIRNGVPQFEPATEAIRTYDLQIIDNEIHIKE